MNGNQEVREHRCVPLCEESAIVRSKMGEGSDTGTPWASMVFSRAAPMTLTTMEGTLEMLGKKFLFADFS